MDQKSPTPNLSNIYIRLFLKEKNLLLNERSQHAERTLNKIEKTFNGPFLGERACFRGSEYILFEILYEGHRNGQLDSLAELTTSRPNGLSCLAGRFYGLQSKISNKMYSEPLKHALSPRKGPDDIFFSFI